MKRALFAFLTLSGSEAVSGTTPAMLGEWCDTNAGGVLFIERESLGVNEHMMCDWRGKPNFGDALEIMIDCRDIYFTSEGPKEMNPQSMSFSAQLINDTKLSVKFGTADRHLSLTRCE